MKSNKGFTLIELLAVIVVLAIIALIAVPMVLNTIAEARKGAAQSSAYAYIAKVEEKIALDMINSGTSSVASVTLGDTIDTYVKNNIKGTTPSAVSISVSNGQVKAATFTISGYTVTYNGSTATVSA